MSELDRDNAKTLDDVETDSIEEIEEDTDETVQVAQMTDRTSFQAQLRAFFGLFTIVRDQITLKIIDDDKWEKNKRALEVHLEQATTQELLDIPGHIWPHEEVNNWNCLGQRER